MPSHEFDESPHSRTASEKPTALGDTSASPIFATHFEKSLPNAYCVGIGRPAQVVSSAHICSMSSMTGGTTRPWSPWFENCEPASVGPACACASSGGATSMRTATNDTTTPLTAVATRPLPRFIMAWGLRTLPPRRLTRRAPLFALF